MATNGEEKDSKQGLGIVLAIAFGIAVLIACVVAIVRVAPCLRGP